MLKLLQGQGLSIQVQKRRATVLGPPAADTMFARFPHLAEKLAALTVGGVPLFTSTGEFNPALDVGRRGSDDDLETRTPSRPERPLRRIA